MLKSSPGQYLQALPHTGHCWSSRTGMTGATGVMQVHCWGGKGSTSIHDLLANSFRVLSAHLPIILISLLAASHRGGQCWLLMPLISSTGRASLQQMRQPLSPCHPQPCSFWGAQRQQLWKCKESPPKLQGAGGRCSTWHLCGINFPKHPHFVPGPVLTGAFPRG